MFERRGQHHFNTYPYDNEVDELSSTVYVEARRLRIPVFSLLVRQLAVDRMSATSFNAGKKVLEHLAAIRQILDAGPVSGLSSSIETIVHSIRQLNIADIQHAMNGELWLSFKEDATAVLPGPDSPCANVEYEAVSEKSILDTRWLLEPRLRSQRLSGETSFAHSSSRARRKYDASHHETVQDVPASKRRVLVDRTAWDNNSLQQGDTLHSAAQNETKPNETKPSDTGGELQKLLVDRTVWDNSSIQQVDTFVSAAQIKAEPSDTDDALQKQFIDRSAWDRSSLQQGDTFVSATKNKAKPSDTVSALQKQAAEHKVQQVFHLLRAMDIDVSCLRLSFVKSVLRKAKGDLDSALARILDDLTTAQDRKMRCRQPTRGADCQALIDSPFELRHEPRHDVQHVLPPIKLPMALLTEREITAPVDPAITPPVESPVTPPIESSNKPHVESPDDPPVESPPNQHLVDSPIEPPLESIQPHLELPIEPPLESPIEHPFELPIEHPVESPVKHHIGSAIEPDVETTVAFPVMCAATCGR